MEVKMKPQIIISDILQLLHKYNYRNFDLSFEKINETLEFDKIEASRLIISIYGGMGSFSDIVLSVGVKMVIEDNNKLASFKKKLYKYAEKNLK